MQNFLWDLFADPLSFKEVSSFSFCPVKTAGELFAFFSFAYQFFNRFFIGLFFENRPQSLLPVRDGQLLCTL